MTDVETHSLALVELQRRRKFAIKTALRLTNAGGALARSFLGWRLDLPEDERARIARDAARMVADVRRGAEGGDCLIAPDLRALFAGLEPVEAHRHALELEMARIARKLPGHTFVKGIRGFGDLAFAVIVGEAGSLTGYANPAKLWRRLGLAPFNGKSGKGWRIEGGLSSDDWSAFGYAPGRRAEVHACLGEPLFRCQTPVVGPYRLVYDRRRARTAETHPDWTKRHSHDDALRVMTKQAIVDLWSAWRRAVSGLDSEGAKPAAEQSPQGAGEAGSFAFPVAGMPPRNELAGVVE